MANLSAVFQSFSISISLTKTDIKYLRKARRTVTGKIREHIIQNNFASGVEFKGQGSFSMGTIIRSPGTVFDIDVGVYLKGFPDDRELWPGTETVSSWLINPLQTHTSFYPINKRKCVRINYKSNNKQQDLGYHVDLPVYVECNSFWDGKHFRIGIIGEKQWSEKSDPLGFTNWFVKMCQKNKGDKNQLILLVKYIKAWKDFEGKEDRFPSGMALTVLMGKNFVPHERDDVAFSKTIAEAYDSFDDWFWINNITNPVGNNNSLTEKLTYKQKKVFAGYLKKLVADAKLAISEPDNLKAYELWSTHFDVRFQYY